MKELCTCSVKNIEDIEASIGVSYSWHVLQLYETAFIYVTVPAKTGHVRTW